MSKVAKYYANIILSFWVQIFFLVKWAWTSTCTDSEAKYDIYGPELIYNHGFKKNELRMIESIIEENREIIEQRWREIFKKHDI